MQILISWLLQKPTDLDLHCLQRQGISRFSRTTINVFSSWNFIILIWFVSNTCTSICILMEELVRKSSTGASNEYTQQCCSFLWRTGDNYPRIIIKESSLTFITCSAISTDNKLVILFLYLPENRIWHFLQLVSIGDNLHKMSNPVFWDISKYFLLKILPRVPNINKSPGCENRKSLSI